MKNKHHEQLQLLPLALSYLPFVASGLALVVLKIRKQNTQDDDEKGDDAKRN